MKDYKYEQVKDMTVGQVVDEYMDSDRIYADYSGEMCLYHSNDWDLNSLKDRLEKGLIYIKIEAPWWEGCEGGVIMVRNTESEDWEMGIFQYLDTKRKTFCCGVMKYQLARPLTQAEKDAIITEN